MTRVFKPGVWLVIVLLASLAMPCHAKRFEYLPDLEIVDLKPQMREESYSSTRYTLDTNKIASMLDNILVFDTTDDFEDLPYVVAFENDSTMGGTGDVAYVVGIDPKSVEVSYSLLSPGKVYKHPATGDMIGLQAYVVGKVELRKGGHPQTVEIISSSVPVERGMRLTPIVGVDLPSVFDAKYPTRNVLGYVLSIQKDSLGGGANSIVAVNLGRKDGLFQGSILDLREHKREVVNLIADDKISLPKVKFGEVLIYKVADKFSLGIVTYANRMLQVNDRVVVDSQEY